MNKLGESGLYTAETKRRMREEQKRRANEIKVLQERAAALEAERDELAQKGPATVRLDEEINEVKAEIETKSEEKPTLEIKRVKEEADDNTTKKPAKKKRAAKTKEEPDDDELARPAKKAKTKKEVKEEEEVSNNGFVLKMKFNYSFETFADVSCRRHTLRKIRKRPPRLQRNLEERRRSRRKKRPNLSKLSTTRTPKPPLRPPRSARPVGKKMSSKRIVRVITRTSNQLLKKPQLNGNADQLSRKRSLKNQMMVRLPLRMLRLREVERLLLLKKRQLRRISMTPLSRKRHLREAASQLLRNHPMREKLPKKLLNPRRRALKPSRKRKAAAARKCKCVLMCIRRVTTNSF